MKGWYMEQLAMLQLERGVTCEMLDIIKHLRGTDTTRIFVNGLQSGFKIQNDWKKSKNRINGNLRSKYRINGNSQNTD